MRRFALMTALSLLAVPAVALAQDINSPPAQPAPPYQPLLQSPPPPDQPGAPPYDPGTEPGVPAPDATAPGVAPPGGHHHHDGDAGMMQKWQTRFEAANTTHDGHLTLQQAQAAGMKPVVEHFSQIDVHNRGYVTFNEVMAWHLDEMAHKMEQKAEALRAQD